MHSNKILNLVFFVLFVGSLTQAYSQERIQMQNINGKYLVPCKINKLDLKLIFDPEAASVSLSITEAQFMLKNGIIYESDLSGAPINLDSDIKNTENTKLNIRELSIGNATLLDVEAIIVLEHNAPLHLGQSALNKLGNYSIEGDELVIIGTDEQTSADPCDIAQIDLQNAELARSRGEKSGDENNHWQASQNYYLAFAKCPDLFTPATIMETARYMSDHKSYKSAISLYKHYLNVFNLGSPDANRINVEIGRNQQLLGNFDEAYSSYLQAYLNSKDIGKNSTKVYYQNIFGELEFERGNYQEAKQRYEYAAQYQLCKILAFPEDVNNNKVSDELLGDTFLMLAKCCGELGSIEEGQTYIILSAKCGNKEAIDRCNELKIVYRKDAPLPLENLLIYPSDLDE